MWRALVLSCLLASGAHAGPISFADPPERYRGDISVFVVTKSPEEVATYCRAWGTRIDDALCCYIPALNTIVMPNPFKTDRYVVSQCFRHEGGHANDWPGNHPP